MTVINLQSLLKKERKFGPTSQIIQTILTVFNQGQYKKTFDLRCLHLSSQLIDGALDLVFNIKPTSNYMIAKLHTKFMEERILMRLLLFRKSAETIIK